MKVPSKTLVLPLLPVLTVLAFLPFCRADDEVSIYDKIPSRSELPTGGTFIDDPTRQDREYYFTNRQAMWPDPGNARKHSGLYLSDDGGKTWKLRCHFFEFEHVFPHPKTGTLYAIIDYTWLAENKEGFLWPHYANKALMSRDGRHWKDITGPPGYVADMTGFMVDPDHPSRVCVQAWGLRPHILQSSDDTYSTWTWHDGRDWPTPKTPIKDSEQEDGRQP